MKKKQGIAIFLCLAMLLTICTDRGEISAKKKKALKDYSTTSYNWGLSLNKNHKKSGGSGPRGWKLKKDDAYYVGKHSKKDKVIYLTFDCGYEAGYTKKILKMH